ncbi:MAG: mercuric reductase [Anaerolineales bacterium]|nr:mercuric reductase [Anaerolineales bacterium]MCA9927993.1 mercuric reductase [Anaerolineales bacterium]
MKEYDAIIIGSGQGGGPLAHKFSDLGWKVAFIEKDHLGGSCINYGCTPTKTMVASARVAHYVRRAAEFGVAVGEVTVNLADVVARKDKLVKEWRAGQEHHVSSRETLDLYRGHGRFTAPHVVKVNGELLMSDKIFINTGTRPRVIPIEGLETVDYLTNRNIMDLQALPEHLLILGGSYLGLEFGQMFRRFGSQVTVVEFMDRIIPCEDADVSQALQEALAGEGMQFATGAKATKVEKKVNGVALTVERQDGSVEVLSGSHLFIGIGRTPNSDDLGLEKAGIETERGFIKVNEKLETNVPGVWALGDVKGGPAFTHVAYDDHLILYDNVVKGKERTVNGRIIPYALFTDPELGRVGLTETQAREAGYNIKVGKIPMAWVARAIERSETNGLMKIVIDADTDQILGATILGIEGGEVVQVLVTAMRNRIPWTKFYRDMYIHPTVVEGFFTLMDNVAPAN